MLYGRIDTIRWLSRCPTKRERCVRHRLPVDACPMSEAARTISPVPFDHCEESRSSAADPGAAVSETSPRAVDGALLSPE